MKIFQTRQLNKKEQAKYPVIENTLLLEYYLIKHNLATEMSKRKYMLIGKTGYNILCIYFNYNSTYKRMLYKTQYIQKNTIKEKVIIFNT